MVVYGKIYVHLQKKPQYYISTAANTKLSANMGSGNVFRASRILSAFTQQSPDPLKPSPTTPCSNMCTNIGKHTSSLR